MKEKCDFRHEHSLWILLSTLMVYFTIFFLKRSELHMILKSKILSLNKPEQDKSTPNKNLIKYSENYKIFILFVKTQKGQFFKIYFMIS